MRLELNKNLQDALDKIKKENSLECSNSKGHIPTVEFLVRYYRQHKRLEKLSDEFTYKIQNIPGIIEKAVFSGLSVSIREVLANIILNSLPGKDTKKRRKVARGSQDIGPE